MNKKRTPKNLKGGLEISVWDHLPNGTQYEPYFIEYYEPIRSGTCEDCNGNNVWKSRNYLPDFVLPNGMIVETKGKFRPADRTKHLLLKEQYNSEIRFIFMLDNWLTKKHVQRYSDWCDAHEIKSMVWFQNSKKRIIYNNSLEELQLWINETHM